jgi:beta-lactamase class A
MPWRVAIGKELRALFPMWMAVCAAIVASQFVPGLRAAWSIYILGAVVLGAMSIGHEYLHGTLASWLSLPANRWQLLAAKLAAVSALLTPLVVLAIFGIAADNGHRFPESWGLASFAITVPFVYALVVTPWLTMVARGPLGGVVFTLVVPFAVPVVTELVRPLDLFFLPSFGQAMFVIAGVAAVLGARTFARLEALDTDRDVELPKLFGALATSYARRPILALIGKELRLQQMTVLVAVLSFSAVLVARWLHRIVPVVETDLTYPLSMVHLCLGPMLAAALASAEERRFGTLEWQVLQPTTLWKQWLVKVFVAVGLGLLVSLGSLALLLAWDPALDVVGGHVSEFPLYKMILPVAAIALATLYVSSLSSSGLRAAVTTIPVLAIVAALGVLAGVSVASTLRGPYYWWHTWPGSVLVSRSAWFSQHTAELVRTGITWVCFGLIGGFVALVFRNAMDNHRSADRGARRIVLQVLAMAGYALIGLFIFGALMAFYSAGVTYRLTPEQQKAVSVAAARRERWQQAFKEITGLARGFDGKVGVCAGDGRVETCVLGDERFPMQSVMKLPVAIAALQAVDKGTWHLDDQVLVHKQDLSVFVQPMAKLVGPKGFRMTIDDLIRRAIVDSDSAATDILIARLGGPLSVQTAINRKWLPNIRVDRDEKHLQTEINGLEWRDEYLDPATLDRAINAVPDAQRDAAFQKYVRDPRDTSTPRAMTFLLGRLAGGGLLSPASTKRLLEILTQTTTFPDRLKAGVPDGWTIGHKTGTSGSWRGVTAAFSDVGILTGPKGETISIAVFISDSKASDKDMAKLMADIARAIATKY